MVDTEQSDNFVKGKKGNYLLDRRPFAFGGTSALWKATDNNNNLVCIKSFHRSPNTDSVDQFINELLARQATTHPHILPVLDYGYEGISLGSQYPFIVLPFCTGGNLRELMRGRDFVSPQVFFPILKQIALAIDFAHSNGIIHGDIKPENILFQDENKQYVQLADFGISIFFSVFAEISTTFNSTPFGGTISYLSPEQIDQNRQTSSSDIYTLAVVAYEALTGRLPFDSNAPPFQQMYQKVSGRLLDPLIANGHLSEAIGKGLLAGLDVDPLKRPRTGMEFYNLLQGNHLKSNVPIGRLPENTVRKFDREDIYRFYKILCERFSLEEVRDFCFFLNIDYDDLAGLGRSEKVRELLTYLVRRNRLANLVEIGGDMRPDIDWLSEKSG